MNSTLTSAIRSSSPTGVLAIMTCVLLASCGRSDPPAAPFAGEFLNDFGEVEFTGSGMSIEHEFSLSNTTGRTVEIEKLTSSCGCVTPRANSMTINPGEELIISTAMTMTRPGRKSEHINIVFKRDFEPIRLKLEAVARLVIELTAIEPFIILNSVTIGTLTLQVKTTIADWPPPEPYFSEIDGTEIEFEGWQILTTADPAVHLWQGLLRLIPGNRPPAGIDTIALRVGHSNEIEVPLRMDH